MIVVVPVEPTESSRHLPELVAGSVVSRGEATELYAAAVTDVVRAVESSGGSLLVNYRDGSANTSDGDENPETASRELVTEGLSEPDAPRFERQVGSNTAARIGNTVTHLLEREDARSVSVLEPTAPLIRRTEIDGVAMATRRNDVVLGANGAGGVYLSAFATTIDFAGAYDAPALATLAERAGAAELAIGFAPAVPTIDTEAGLATTIATIDARAAAGKPVPEATARTIDDLGLFTPDGRSLVRS